MKDWRLEGVGVEFLKQYYRSKLIYKVPKLVRAHILFKQPTKNLFTMKKGHRGFFLTQKQPQSRTPPKKKIGKKRHDA